MVRRIAFGMTALLLVAGAFGASFWVQYAYRRPGPQPAMIDLVIPHGGLKVIAPALLNAQLIDNIYFFEAAALATRASGPLHAAEFQFPPQASIKDILLVLRTAKPVQHKLTIPEGLSATQVAALINQAPALTGSVAAPPEGAILPETYDYEFDTPRAQIVARASKAQAKALDRLWAQRPPGLGLATPAQAVTLASIVEHETGLPAERPHVASVFLNRLRLGMKLQSDPTVVYGLTEGRNGLDHRLSRTDLLTDTPYNTYLHEGLPPGPIDNPGLASLKAVLNPAPSTDLYFVATGHGGHAFAANLPEHDRNVARYRAWQAQQPSQPAIATPPMPTP